MKKQNLIFIYNANSGLASAALDSLHKVFSPGTYKCDLCKVTYGLKSMKPEWKEYVKSLSESGFEISFLHKDEVKKISFELPCVLLNDELLLSKSELNMCTDVDMLIQKMRDKLEVK